MTPLRIKRQSMMPPPRHPAAQAHQDRAEYARQQTGPGPHPSEQNTTGQERDSNKLHREKTQQPPQAASATPIVPPPTYRPGNLAPDSRSDRERKAKSGRFWGFGKGESAVSGQRTAIGTDPSNSYRLFCPSRYAGCWASCLWSGT